MSTPPYAPGAHPWPAPAPRRPAPKPRPARVPWTWLERFLVIQSALPALLFIPGMSASRIFVRMSVFLLPLFAWSSLVRSGRMRPGAETFPATAWLKLATGWLLLMILHPGTRSPVAGLGQALFYISVFSPAFWAPGALASPRQLGRVMTILLLTNGFSSALGLAQVFRPGTFNPPVIAGVTGSEDAPSQAMVYTDEHGNRIVRPCGLSDQPGNAAMAGAFAVMIGLAMALRPIGNLRRLACLAASFCSMAAIYYSQTRMIFMLALICMVTLVVVFALQGNFRHATLLGGLGAAMIVGALSWVMARSGRVVVERFLAMGSNDFGTTYQGSGRAGFVVQALTQGMWEDPLGMGIGRWGTISSSFGAGGNTGLWVEVMIPGWVADGGIPLLVLYCGALVVTMANTLRIALKSRDDEIRFWAAVAFASSLAAIATCFSYVTFVTYIGMQFWFLSAVVHAADYRARREAAARARAPAARPAPGPAPPPPPWPSPA
jgi:hypothetical protein